MKPREREAKIKTENSDEEVYVFKDVKVNPYFSQK